MYAWCEGHCTADAALGPQEVSTALVLACIEAGELGAARRVAAQALAAGHGLQLRAHNALINALGRATRLGDAVRRPAAGPSATTG